MTGNGAVGFPLMAPIKSGNAKKPINIKNKNERRLKTIKSVKVRTPYINKQMPIPISPTTKENNSNIFTAS